VPAFFAGIVTSAAGEGGHALRFLEGCCIDSMPASQRSTDFPRLDLRGSRLVPRDSGILKSENSDKSSVYVLPKSCGQPLGEIWPRNRFRLFPLGFGHRSLSGVRRPRFWKVRRNFVGLALQARPIDSLFVIRATDDHLMSANEHNNVALDAIAVVTDAYLRLLHYGGCS
jgi:hypothetical protein